MNTLSWLCLFIFLSILSNPSLSATIIITPSDPNPTQLTRPKPNSNSPLIDSTYLVQVIKDYFGCAQFSNGVCVRCQNKYFLNSDGRCSRVSDDCRTFNIDEGLCTQCLKGSVLVDGICYPTNSPANSLKNHCVIWSNQQCLKCQKGYFLSSSSCKPVDTNFQCRHWSQQGTCLTCNHGFILSNGNCIQSSKFINCPSNQYFSQNGKCQLAPANCETWDPYNGKCVKCFNEFDWVDWKCSCSSNGYCSNQYCERFNLEDKKFCDLCVSGYILDNGKCNDKPLPNNCAKWNQNKTLCAGCKQNYFLNAPTRQCILQIQNCQKYGPAGNCINCNDKYQLVGLRCEEIIIITNCEKYYPLNRNQCSVCKLGYVLQRNTCVPKPLPLNCIKWNQNYTECAQCQQKWVLNHVNRQCVQYVENCLTYGITGECKVCAQQYELSNIKCQLIVMIPNCQKYAINNRRQCTQCQQGYQVSNGQCREKQLSVNCLSWNKDKSSCGQCKVFFILTERGFCFPKVDNCKIYSVNGDCAKCNENYEIIDKKCQLTVVIPNCIKYNPSNRFQCIECSQSFVVSNGQCKQKPLPKNCQKWDDEKISCSKCKAKFILNITSGQCSEQVVNCQKNTSSGQCIACIDNYVVTESVCRLKADTMISSQFYGCDTWNFTANKCNNCFDTFDLNKQGYCFYNEDHCLQRNERSFCTKCKQSYVVISGNCQVKSDAVIENKVGCKVFDWVNNICLVCEDDFVRNDNGECLKPIENCLEQGTNRCTKCSTNYDLKNGKCESFATSRCIEMDDKKLCKRCQNSFALIAGECRTFKQLGTILLDYNQFSPEKLKEKIIIFTDKPQI